MNWSEHRIAGAIARQTLASKCVVLVDNCNWTGHECDILGVTRDLRIIDVEVKISRADLRADAAKSKWWHFRFGSGPSDSLTPRVWPPRVWKHYYAVPAEIWTSELAAALPSPASGILTLTETPPHDAGVIVTCVRRAKPDRSAYRLSAADVMDIARLANLRMWDAYRIVQGRTPANIAESADA